MEIQTPNLCVVQFTIDGEQSALNQVLGDFHEDDLVLRETTEYPSLTSGGQMFEVQTDEGEILARFHETCLEYQVTLAILRIHHEQDRAEKPTAIGETKTSRLGLASTVTTNQISEQA